MTALQHSSFGFGWNGSLYSGRLPDLCGGCGARVSRSASANCACLHVDLLLSIYVIAKPMGGLQERGGCHGLVNHRYVLTHTLCLDSTRTSDGVFVLSWRLLNDLLSLHTFITDVIVRNLWQFFCFGEYTICMPWQDKTTSIFYIRSRMCDSHMASLFLTQGGRKSIIRCWFPKAKLYTSRFQIPICSLCSFCVFSVCVCVCFSQCCLYSSFLM